jgi:polyribonucleotide nucleotidyltransferase
MDFKVAGTRTGVTAIQLDTKIRGLTLQQVRETIEKATAARMTVLDVMDACIDRPRPELSRYAPRVIMIEIHPDKIGDVIGPGGKIIKKIEADTGAKLSIEQDGRVFITCTDAEGGERAAKIVQDLTREVRVGETFLGTVVRTATFGAFVELLPGKDGLLRIQEMSDQRIGRTEDVLNVGDEVMVKVEEIDDMGRINLSRRGLVAQGLAEPLTVKPGSAPPSQDERRGGGHDRSGRGGGGGGRDRDRGGRDRQDRQQNRGGRDRRDERPQQQQQRPRPDHNVTSLPEEPRPPQARFRPKQ